jgi:hypothetical protein
VGDHARLGLILAEIGSVVRVTYTGEMGMFNRLLKFGARFDLFSPAAALFNDATNGPAEFFRVPLAAGWSTFDLADLLRNSGIGFWGMRLRDDDITFRVKENQAAFTAYLLDRAAIDYDSSWAGDQSASVRSRPKTKSANATEGPVLDGLLRRLNQLIDQL